MLQKLLELKNYTTLQLIQVKTNIFIPKLYKINLINYLVIVYTNLKNNLIKVTNTQWSALSVHYFYSYLIWIIFFVESVLWFVL